MEEKELIAKIRKLKQIRPKKAWVLETKSQILGKEWEIFPFFKPIYAGLFSFLILIALFEFSQSALPGQPLYPLKRITEKLQEIFVSEEELPKVQLELANKKVEELNQIAQTNQVKKLAPAIKEVQTSLSQVAKNLGKSKNVDRETVGKILSLKQNLKKAETTLAIEIASQEEEEVIDSFEKSTVESIIKDLENRLLTEKQEDILAKMKELVKEGKYLEALELYLINQ